MRLNLPRNMCVEAGLILISLGVSSLTCLPQLMLSIGKLAHLAQVQGPEGSVDESVLDGMWHTACHFWS